MNSVPSVSHVSPRQVIAPPPLEKKNEGTGSTEKPLQGAKGRRSASPVEVCDAAPGIFTGQDTGITKPVRHTTLCHRETERNAAQGATMATSAASSSVQMQSRHELRNIAGLETLVLAESEKKDRAVGTRFAWLIDTLESLLQENPEKEGQKMATTLRTAVTELKDIVVGPVDASRRKEMENLMSMATELQNKGQADDAKKLLDIVTEYTTKHHDFNVSSRLLQLKGDTAAHEKKTEEGPLFSRESDEQGNYWNFNKNLNVRVAGLSSSLGIDVIHGNRQLTRFDPDQFYQDIQQLLKDYKKLEKELNKSPDSTLPEYKPGAKAFFDALEAIFEEEKSGAGTSRDLATAKFERSINQLKREGAHMDKELNLVTDILKFARNLTLVKQGDYIGAIRNMQDDKSSDTFSYLDDYIRCEYYKQEFASEAIKFCERCLRCGAPFSDYLSSLHQEHPESQYSTKAHASIYGEEECG